MFSVSKRLRTGAGRRGSRSQRQHPQLQRIPSQLGLSVASKASSGEVLSRCGVAPLSDLERALLRSQHGPLAFAAMRALQTSRTTKIAAQQFRLLLCRRLRLPLPSSSRTCRCGRQLNVFGHHRAACAQAGVLGKTGFALKCAAAQMCTEGARVATNVFVRDLDLGEFNAQIGGHCGWANSVAKISVGHGHHARVSASRRRHCSQTGCCSPMALLWMILGWSFPYPPSDTRRSGSRDRFDRDQQEKDF